MTPAGFTEFVRVKSSAKTDLSYAYDGRDYEVPCKANAKDGVVYPKEVGEHLKFYFPDKIFLEPAEAQFITPKTELHECPFTGKKFDSFALYAEHIAAVANQQAAAKKAGESAPAA